MPANLPCRHPWYAERRSHPAQQTSQTWDEWHQRHPVIVGRLSRGGGIVTYRCPWCRKRHWQDLAHALHASRARVILRQPCRVWHRLYPAEWEKTVDVVPLPILREVRL